MFFSFFDLFSGGEPQTLSRPKASAAIEAEASSKTDAATSAAGEVAETAATGTAARMFRLPVRLFRWSRVARLVAYAGAGAAVTWTAEKLLDYAYQASPDSVAIAKADFVARKAWSAEKFLFHAGLSVAGTTAGAAYDAIPQQPGDSVPAATKQAAPVGMPLALVSPAKPDAPNDQGQTRTLAAVSPTPTKSNRPHIASLRNADIPDPETERLNRQELARHMKPPVELAPDGMPAPGGYDPATSINWGPYMQDTPVTAPPLATIEPAVVPPYEAAMPVSVEPAYLVPEQIALPDRRRFHEQHYPRPNEAGHPILGGRTVPAFKPSRFVYGPGRL